MIEFPHQYPYRQNTLAKEKHCNFYSRKVHILYLLFPLILKILRVREGRESFSSNIDVIWSLITSDGRKILVKSLSIHL